MKKFIVVCVAALFVVIVPVEYGWAFGGHGGGHGGHSGGHHGHFRGHFGGHGFHRGHFGHFGKRFGGHGFHGGHFGKFGRFPHGKIFRHRGGFLHRFGHGGFFPHHGGFGGFFTPFAFRVGPPVVIIKDPFFCFPHSLGFTAEDPFFTHLQDIHGIPPGRAPAYLVQTGGRFLFLRF